MVPLSLGAPELDLMIGIIGVLIFIGAFVALLFSAVFVLGLIQLLYVGCRWSVMKIHHSYSLNGTRMMIALGRIVAHH